MANLWDPERVVSADLALFLIESAFPDLTPVHIQPFGAGWDNTAFLVNHDLVFRFPRRQIAVPLINTEARVLRELAPRLPLPIPVPHWIGHSTDERFPWPFLGYRRIPGLTAFEARVDNEDRILMARPLAEFLAVLHGLPLTDATRWGVGPDTIDRVDIERRCPKMRESLEGLVERRALDDARPWLDIIDAAAGLPGSSMTTLVHGDFHSAHLIVEQGKTLSGIIDWGDMHCGHPASDLSIAWTFFPPAGRELFLATYGSIEPATRSLARFHALVLALNLEAYGRDQCRPGVLAEAESILNGAGLVQSHSPRPTALRRAASAKG